MPGFDVEPWEIASTAGLVGEVGEQLRAGLNRLGLDVESLLAGWHGQAGVAFAGGWDEWQAGASDVLTALDAMAQLLERAGQGYGSAESANVSALA
ncbi:MAG: WXG100 family type VII secretion target [Jatrophihabitantaceae bacterium]